MAGELAHEVQHESTHESPLAATDEGHAGPEQMTCVDCREITIPRGIVCHRRDNADAEPQANICLDHIRVRRRKDNVRLQSGREERLVETGVAGEPEDICHQGLLRHILQCDRPFRRQRMVVGDHDGTRPAVARHHDQVVEMFHALGGDGELDLPVFRESRDLLWGALIHVQRHLRVFRPKRLYHRR